MPLTSPDYTSRASRCSVTVTSIDRDIRISIILTPEQAEAWDDAALTEHVKTLTDSIRGFLVPGEVLRVNVAWQGSASVEIMSSDEVIEAPSEPAGEPAA